MQARQPSGQARQLPRAEYYWAWQVGLQARLADSCRPDWQVTQVSSEEQARHPFEQPAQLALPVASTNA